MDISREKSVSPESASIRLRYSTQFSSGGRTQNIDTEISLPVGASQEIREQIIREAELGVEQLMRQIAQRGGRATQSQRTSEQTSSRPPASPAAPSVVRPGITTRPQNEPTSAPRQTTNPSLPATRAPVGESMPPTPVPNGEGKTIRLPDFINAIKRRWNMSPKEAMDLLGVEALDGLNYREIYRQIEELLRQKDGPRAASQQTQQRPSSATPIVEAPRSNTHGTQSPSPRASLNTSTSAAPGARAQNQAALKQAARPAPPTIPVPSETSAPTREESTLSARPEAGKNFAGSPKAPIPLHIGVGVVRDSSAQQAYKFDEEDGEEDENEENYDMPDDEDEEQARLSAQIKLDELKETHGTNAASAERLRVLNNVMGSQISEEQLQKIMLAAWNTNNKKKLKGDQVEALVSWAKQDFFIEEVEAMLALIDEGEV